MLLLRSTRLCAHQTGHTTRTCFANRSSMRLLRRMINDASVRIAFAERGCSTQGVLQRTTWCKNSAAPGGASVRTHQRCHTALATHVEAQRYKPALPHSLRNVRVEARHMVRQSVQTSAAALPSLCASRSRQSVRTSAVPHWFPRISRNGFAKRAKSAKPKFGTCTAAPNRARNHASELMSPSML